MDCRPAFFVQGTEDYLFLRADGEGGVCFCHLISQATPFSSPDSAHEAVQDHFGGLGMVFKVFLPMD